MKNNRYSYLKLLNILSLILPLLLTVNQDKPFIITIFTVHILTVLLNLKCYKDDIDIKGIKKIFMYFVLFAVYSFAVCFVSRWLNKILTTTILILASIILMILVTYTDKHSKDNRLVLYKIIYVIVIIMCIYSVILWSFGDKFITLDSIGNGGKQSMTFLGIRFSQNAMGDENIGYAVSSFTKNPNTFSFLIFLAIILLTNRNVVDLKIKKRYAMLQYAILFMALYIAHSRAIILICILYLFNRMIQIIKKRKLRVLMYMFLALSLLICVIVAINLNAKISIELNGRNEMWQIVTNVINDIIVFGNGLGSSELVLFDVLGETTSMHSAYLSMIFEYGLIPTTVIIIQILMFIFKSFNRTRKFDSAVKIDYYILILILILGITEGTFMKYSYYNYLAVMAIANIYKIRRKSFEKINSIHTNIQ